MEALEKANDCMSFDLLNMLALFHDLLVIFQKSTYNASDSNLLVVKHGINIHT